MPKIIHVLPPSDVAAGALIGYCGSIVNGEQQEVDIIPTWGQSNVGDVRALIVATNDDDFPPAITLVDPDGIVYTLDANPVQGLTLPDNFVTYVGTTLVERDDASSQPPIQVQFPNGAVDVTVILCEWQPPS
jgi:hypothetical protein